MIQAVNGADWFYTDQGRGDPLLFMHGGFDASANFPRLCAALAETFRVIAVDRRGHGRSADTDAPFDYALMAEEVHEFITTLGLGKMHVVGYSDGANVGFHLASRHPESVARFVAVSGNYRGLSGMSEKWLASLPKLSLEYVEERMHGVLEQYAELNPAPDPAVFVAKTCAIWRKDVVVTEEALRAITAKTLLVCGDRDIVLPEQTLAMRGLISGSSLLILPDTGHAIFQDFAWNAVSEAALGIIRHFLVKQDKSI